MAFEGKQILVFMRGKKRLEYLLLFVLFVCCGETEEKKAAQTNLKLSSVCVCISRKTDETVTQLQGE